MKPKPKKPTKPKAAKPGDPPPRPFPPNMRWGWRAVHPDGMSRNTFRWPLGGGWVDARGPILNHNGACPEADGDGICVGLSAHGVASGGISAITCLIVGWLPEDELGREAGNKVRVRRAFVLEVVDLPRWIREWKFYGADLSGANLSRANLYGANLSGANLSRANLSGADLSRANLYEANLYGANLSGADLSGAELSRANLSGANLSRANLYEANLYGANLSGASLSGADLSRAKLSGANLSGACNKETAIWPDGFDWKGAKHGR